MLYFLLFSFRSEQAVNTSEKRRVLSLKRLLLMPSQCGLDHQRMLQLRKKCSEMSLVSQAHCWNPKRNNLQAAPRMGFNWPSWKVLPGNSDRWSHHSGLWLVSQHDSWIILRSKSHFWELCSHVTVQCGKHLQGGCSGHLLQRGYLVPFEMPTGHPGTPSAGPVLHLPWGCLRCPPITPQMALALQAVEESPLYCCCTEQPPKMSAHQCIVCWIHSDWNETKELLVWRKQVRASLRQLPRTLPVWHCSGCPQHCLLSLCGRALPTTDLSC